MSIESKASAFKSFAIGTLILGGAAAAAYAGYKFFKFGSKAVDEVKKDAAYLFGTDPNAPSLGTDLYEKFNPTNPKDAQKESVTTIRKWMSDPSSAPTWWNDAQARKTYLALHPELKINGGGGSDYTNDLAGTSYI